MNSQASRGAWVDKGSVPGKQKESICWNIICSQNASVRPWSQSWWPTCPRWDLARWRWARRERGRRRSRRLKSWNGCFAEKQIVEEKQEENEKGKMESVGNLKGKGWGGILMLNLWGESRGEPVMKLYFDPKQRHITCPASISKPTYKLYFGSPDAAAVRLWRWGQRRQGRREGWRCRWPGWPDRPLSPAAIMSQDEDQPKCKRKTRNLCLDIVHPRITGVVDWTICWHAFVLIFNREIVLRVTVKLTEYVYIVTIVLYWDTAESWEWFIWRLFLIRIRIQFLGKVLEKFIWSL